MGWIIFGWLPLAASWADPATPDASRFQSFEAEYEQLGQALYLRVRRTGDMLHATFSESRNVDLSSGDHIGLSLPTLRFSYRHLGGLTIVAAGDNIALSRVTMDDPPVLVIKPVPEPVYDGTLSYWLIAGLPLAAEFEATLPVLLPRFPERDDFRVGEAHFEVVGSKSFRSDQQTYDCWIVESEAPGGRYLTCIADTPPYLVEQRHVAADGSTQTVIELRRLH